MLGLWVFGIRVVAEPYASNSSTALGRNTSRIKGSIGRLKRGGSSGVVTIRVLLGPSIRHMLGVMILRRFRSKVAGAG